VAHFVFNSSPSNFVLKKALKAHRHEEQYVLNHEINSLPGFPTLPGRRPTAARSKTIASFLAHINLPTPCGFPVRNALKAKQKKRVPR